MNFTQHYFNLGYQYHKVASARWKKEVAKKLLGVAPKAASKDKEYSSLVKLYKNTGRVPLGKPRSTGPSNLLPAKGNPPTAVQNQLTRNKIIENELPWLPPQGRRLDTPTVSKRSRKEIKRSIQKRRDQRLYGHLIA